MNRADKIESSNVFNEKLTKAKVAIFANFKGLTAPLADDLRKVLRQNKAEVRVFKNNVMRLAVKDGSASADAKALMDEIVGPTMVAFSYEDSAAVAKVMHKFSEDNEALQLKDSLMEGKRIGAAEIEALAKLPSKEVLLSMLLGTLNAPARNLVSVLAAVPRALVTVLAAIEKKKGEQQ